jgi:hypothetical protein
MPWWFWVLVAVIVLGAYIASSSNRLDRLHARLDATRAALDAQLLRRSAVTLEIAASGFLDPATSVLLAGAAHEARAVGADAREVDESELSAALRAAFDEPDASATLAADVAGAELLEELEAAATKVPLGRRFYNDAVRANLALRKHRVVRWLHLAGRVPAPTFFEMDDEPPAHLVVDRKAVDNAAAGSRPPDVD